MQFHLNGFKPGNYQIPDAARKPYPNPPVEDLPAKVDVLIVGTGPAGLTMARQMSEFADITACIVDKEPGPAFCSDVPMAFLRAPWKLWKRLTAAKWS